jgi:hypothetical protein
MKSTPCDPSKSSVTHRKPAMHGDRRNENLDSVHCPDRKRQLPLPVGKEGGIAVAGMITDGVADSRGAALDEISWKDIDEGREAGMVMDPLDSSCSRLGWYIELTPTRRGRKLWSLFRRDELPLTSDRGSL